MNENLKRLLDKKGVFKLILGAGNQNAEEIEKIVAIYAKAGCKFFDISADKKVLLAVKRGIEYAIYSDSNYSDYHICVSVGTKNDPHIKKCSINRNLCSNCGACSLICPNSAIFQKDSYPQIDEKSCIGCMMCQKICNKNAIEDYVSDKNLAEVLPELIDLGVDCIEFHTNLDDIEDIQIKLEQINSVYSGMLSICLNRFSHSDKYIMNFIKNIVFSRAPYTTIIQADGSAMSGGNDDYGSNLQALAFVDILSKENLPIFLFASGGVNSKFAQCANQFGIDITGVAMGSFARQAIKEYCQNPEIMTNPELFEQAAKVAESIVKSALFN